MYERFGRVRLFSWNPRRRRIERFGRAIHFGARKNNFGDLLGPLLFKAVAAAEGLGTPRRRADVFTVGSVLHFARGGEVIWGSGWNGKVSSTPARGMNTLAVRGPLTAELLRSHGVEVPPVFGDPAILLPSLFPRQALPLPQAPGRVLMVPNLNDSVPDVRGAEYLSPVGDPLTIVAEIAAADFIVTSSLHAFIVAEAYGVPVQLVVSEHEPLFKYADYVEGTGRQFSGAFSTFGGALAAGAGPRARLDGSALLAAFPRCLWQ